MPAVANDRPALNILWFKRDLRLRDHAPLKAAVDACKRGTPLLLLYCFEPSVMADPNYDLRHWRFVTECLADLNRQLAGITLLTPDERPKHIPLVHEWLPFMFEDALIPDEPVWADLTPGPTRLWVFQREVIDVLQRFAGEVSPSTPCSPTKKRACGLRLSVIKPSAAFAVPTVFPGGSFLPTGLSGGWPTATIGWPAGNRRCAPLRNRPIWQPGYPPWWMSTGSRLSADPTYRQCGNSRMPLSSRGVNTTGIGTCSHFWRSVSPCMPKASRSRWRVAGGAAGCRPILRGGA